MYTMGGLLGLDVLYDYWQDNDVKSIYCQDVLNDTTTGRFIDCKYPFMATARLSGMMLDYKKLVRLGVNGLIDLSEKKGERVKRLIWRNIDLLENPETEMKIVLNSYRASGTGGYDVYRKMRNIRAISVDIQDALIASFENRAVEVPSKTDFSVKK